MLPFLGLRSFLSLRTSINSGDIGDERDDGGVGRSVFGAT